MTDFTYVAITQDGKEKKGTVQANDEAKARVQLKSEGLIPVTIESVNLLNKDLDFGFTKKVKPRELSVFCRQFYSILTAGVTVINALEMLQDQVTNKAFRVAIINTKQSVEKGETLAEAMKESPKIFPNLLINMVEAGEASGSLDVAFSRMAIQFEKSAKIKSLVKKASIYPIILFTVAFGVLIIMSVVVVPQFASMFADMGTELPAVTKLIMVVSDFFKTKWFVLIFIAVLLVAIHRTLKASSNGRMFLGTLSTKIPIIGKLNVKTQSASFARTLSTLISSGLSVTRALDITARSMKNEIFLKAVMDTKEEAERGVPLSAPIKASGVFPPMVSQMLKIGEETGNIEGMLGKVADYYEEESEIATEGLSAAIEPLIIIVMAVIVCVMVMAIYMPMITMYQGMNNL